ncbi:MAG: aminotransferase class I/II-fold pyridoxal phosphate-dependent enzyme [Hyphomicrobiaceae bacterium]|nr:aminotransferase class I/II-fold pyridoxal phosphate-dependent enzyme [Hyphomicrobiaceae bacterium]
MVARKPESGAVVLLPRAPSRRGGIPSFRVMDVMEAAAGREAAGESIIHMEVGQPGTPAPRLALEAVARALPHDKMGYTASLGMPALRERIARHYQQWYGVAVDPSRVVVTAGSSAGFVLSFLALFDVGAKVLLPSPGYPCYRHILTALGQVPCLLGTDAASRWMPTAAQIDAAAAEGAEGLLVASPANPTGTMLDRPRLAELAAACRRNRMWLISDEIYHGLTYEAAAETALAVAPEAIVINSFSKYFSMTGWRVGWIVVPEPLVRPLERLAQNLYISPPGISQVAALAAFEATEELEANKQVYRTNRDLLLAELPKAGFRKIVPADGAFYLYCDVSDLTADSAALSREILAEAGVAATPGLDFDEARGHSFLRFSYAGTHADMQEAVRRLRAWSNLKA